MKRILEGIALFFGFAIAMLLVACLFFKEGTDGKTEIPTLYMDIVMIAAVTLSTYCCSSKKENGKKSRAWITAFIASTSLILIAESGSLWLTIAFLVVCFVTYCFLSKKKPHTIWPNKRNTSSNSVAQVYTPAMAVKKEIAEECKNMGTDLVELANRGPCCERCAKLRRRIYSISGRDRRFPKFPDNYIPDGCLSAYPFLYGVMEPSFPCKDVIQYSNRPFVDDRTEIEVKQYNNWSTVIEKKNSGTVIPTSTSNREIRVTPLYDVAANVIFDTQQASVSMLQRRMGLGYSQAAQIMDYLEECGIVGPFVDSVPRKILITKDEYKRRAKVVDMLSTVDVAKNIAEEGKWRDKRSGKSEIETALDEVDHMEGHQFEYWCAELLQKNRFTNVKVTQGSGDQGVDVLAQKDGVKYAIQCKCYSSDLGNKPIQEVHTGKTIYHCQVGAVMTNRYFTAGAKQAAEATGVLLWDRDRIIEMLK